MTGLIYLAAFVVAILLLVSLHEFGHYIVARWCGVKVLRCSVGCGKPFWKKQRGDTEWCLAPIPLGGYVKMVDTREGEVAEADLPYAFDKQPPLKRIAIVVAGPLVNLLLAVLLYVVRFNLYGVTEVKPWVGTVEKDSIAAKAGFQVGDRITDINGKPVHDWMDAQTELVIGPLARERVEALIASAPRVPVLALNQVATEHANVWEFALAPEEDVSSLVKLMRADGVRDMLLLKEDQQTGNSRFEEVFLAAWQGKVSVINQVPTTLKRDQGILLLGSGAWLEMLNDLPTERIYSTAFAFNQVQPVKLGLQFCDIPALYRPEWPELVRQAEQKPVSIAYQRLVAFGADAWQLALLRLSQAPSANLFGRTGALTLRHNQIERTPDCRKATSTGWARVR